LGKGPPRNHMPRKWLRRRAAVYDKSSSAERTNFPSEVVEMALARAVGGQGGSGLERRSIR
jgi:hypothetical protein